MILSQPAVLRASSHDVAQYVARQISHGAVGILHKKEKSLNSLNFLRVVACRRLSCKTAKLINFLLNDEAMNAEANAASKNWKNFFQGFVNKAGLELQMSSFPTA
jgi:hypothetical protein